MPRVYAGCRRSGELEERSDKEDVAAEGGVYGPEDVNWVNGDDGVYGVTGSEGVVGSLRDASDTTGETEEGSVGSLGGAGADVVGGTVGSLCGTVC